MQLYLDLKDMADNTYLSTTALSAITDIKPSTLEQWRLRRVGFPFIKIGRCVRYRVGDVKAYLASSRVEVDHDGAI